jgi:hypothetical protein
MKSEIGLRVFDVHSYKFNFILSAGNIFIE